VVATFFTPVQTGPGAHPASYTTGTESFLGVKRPGRFVGQPPPSKAEIKERVELYIHSLYGTSWLYFTLIKYLYMPDLFLVAHSADGMGRILVIALTQNRKQSRNQSTLKKIYKKKVNQFF